MKTSMMVRSAILGIVVAAGVGCGAEGPAVEGEGEAQSEALGETSQALTAREATVASLKATRAALTQTDKKLAATLANLATAPNPPIDAALLNETTQQSEFTQDQLEELRALASALDFHDVCCASFA
jgi:predicted Zn-dependent peptidase